MDHRALAVVFTLSLGCGAPVAARSVALVQRPRRPHAHAIEAAANAPTTPRAIAPLATPAPSTPAWECALGGTLSPRTDLAIDNPHAGLFSDAILDATLFVHERTAGRSRAARGALAELRFHSGRGALVARRAVTGAPATSAPWRIEDPRANLARRCDLDGGCELVSATHEFNPPARIDPSAPVYAIELLGAESGFAVAFVHEGVARTSELGGVAPEPPDVAVPDGASLAGLLVTGAGPRPVFRVGESGPWIFADGSPAPVALDACPTPSARPVLGVVAVTVRWSLLSPSALFHAHLARLEDGRTCVRALSGRGLVALAPASLHVAVEGDGVARGLVRTPRGIADVRCRALR
jgi:hypothetical protein